jgi:hypothetical protein
MAAAPTNTLCCSGVEIWRSQMSSCKAKLLSSIAVIGAVALMSASAQAQYVTRSYHRVVHHPYAARSLYDAQAYMAGGINVLPPTIVGGYFNEMSFDPFDMLPSVYGCCATTMNEHVGLAGAAAEGASGR